MDLCGTKEASLPATNFKIYPKRKLVSIYWTSAPSIQGWHDILERILVHPEYERGMNFITCRGGMQPAVTTEYVRQVLDALEQRSARLTPVSLAIVAPGLCDFGMARMMETLSESASVIVRAFRRPREAIEWLKYPVRYEWRSNLAVA
jgi:hypothetical protein